MTDEQFEELLAAIKVVAEESRKSIALQKDAERNAAKGADDVWNRELKL